MEDDPRVDGWAHHEAFVAVLDHGSIRAAARALGLPRPTLSRHLGRLEEDLGVALLHRTTRKVTATAAGQRLYERVAPLLASWAEAELDLAAEAGTASGEVRVNPPAPLAVEAGVHWMQRLSGVPLAGTWGQQWFPETKDRWNVLQTRLVMGSAKVSIDLPKSMGVHIGGNWLFASAEAPSDLFDVSVGWHKYFAPKGG